MGLSEIIWSEWFWFPNGTTWEDLEKEAPPGYSYSKPRDVFFGPIGVAICLSIIRFFFERYIAGPIGRWYGLKDNKPRPPPSNAVLEDAFNNNVSKKGVQALSEKAEMSVREVERWLRRRRAQLGITRLAKFTETLWRLLYYCAIFYYGLYILWDKAWLWDTRQCWYEYPPPISRGVYWYYMLELGFYWSLVFSLVHDNKRKDFIQMTIHHFATIGLMSMSWCQGFVRIGAVILLVHDACDYWMEAAKLAKYVGYQTLCNVCFITFATLWFFTRILYLPTRVIYSTLFELEEVLGPSPSFKVQNTLLVILQVLHVGWFYMIMGVAYKAAFSGKEVRDDRSDDSDESLSSHDGDEEGYDAKKED